MEFIIVGLLVLEMAIGVAAFAFLRWKLKKVNTTLDFIKGTLHEIAFAATEIKGTVLDAKTLRRVEQLLEDAGTRAEEEAAMSKAMEEGISNLLGYSVGKGPGAAT